MRPSLVLTDSGALMTSLLLVVMLNTTSTWFEGMVVCLYERRRSDAECRYAAHPVASHGFITWQTQRNGVRGGGWGGVPTWF
jgi:hypothetical protein